MLGTIARDEESVFREFLGIVERENPAVLEVGGFLDAEIVRDEVGTWVSIDPQAPDARSDRHRTIRGSACDIPLEAGSVDYVFSCNAFEHIHELPLAMREIERVLKKGGVLYTHFGPIWSAPDGHHIENLRVGAQVYDFWTNNIIPHWAHLVFAHHELVEIFRQVYGEEGGRQIADYLVHDQWANRLSYEDYLEIFAGSGLALVHLDTTSEIDYPYDPPDYGLGLDRMRELVAERVDEGRNVETRDLRVVMKKY